MYMFDSRETTILFSKVRMLFLFPGALYQYFANIWYIFFFFENYVFIEQTYWGLKPQATVSLKILRDCSKEVKEEPGYKGVFGKKKPQIKKGSWTSKD